jgi:cell division protein FtsI (penicillin-binding protein 3)
MKDNKKGILWRVYLVYFLVLAFAIAIIARAAYIQFALKEELLKKAEAQEIKYFGMEAIRGNILARDGSLLAASRPDFEIRMDLSREVVSDELFNAGIDSLALMLSKLFAAEKKSATQYKIALLDARRDGKRYFLIQDHVTYDELKQLKTFPIFRKGKYRGGFIVIRKTIREYPYGVLARKTIGDDDSSTQKHGGLEAAYTEKLKGKDGLQLKRRISNGEWIPVSDQPEIVPKDGKDIVTTIDIDIQDLMETALARHLDSNKAYEGCAILMEVKTGEIRAIANLRYDQEKGMYTEQYNTAVRDPYEPGSTFKLASLIVAIEKYNIGLDDYYYVGNGEVQYYGRTMKDSHRPSAPNITVREIFETSSNVGVSQIITRLFSNHPQDYVDYLRQLTLGKPVGVEIPDENPPRLKDPSSPKWSGTTLPWMSIGYESTLTPLHLITLYNAVANNGTMVKPMFVREIREGGQTIQKFEPVVINPSICSASTLVKVKSLLEGVVENGTGSAVKNPIYRVAGKTGTALVYEEGFAYKNKVYNASFVGYFPADNPKYSCLVLVTRPLAGDIYGSKVAAPVFKEIADKVYATQLDIHDDNELTIRNKQSFPASARGYFPALKNSLQTMSYAVYLPASSPEWAEMDTATIGVIIRPVVFGADTMPDMTGMTAKDAVYMMEEKGISAFVDGKGLVASQSVSPGSPLVNGSQVVLTLQNPLP